MLCAYKLKGNLQPRLLSVTLIPCWPFPAIALALAEAKENFGAVCEISVP